MATIDNASWNFATANQTAGQTTNWNPNLQWSNEKDDAATTTTASSDGIVSNPNAELDKDAFMQLLLIELQHQDPTEPMDSEKILTQTAQLSSLEMQSNTNKTMQSMVDTMEILTASFSASMSTSAVAAIGKMAKTSEQTVKLTSPDQEIALSLYMPEASDENGVTVEIYDAKGNLVKTQKGEEKEISAGLLSAGWDGRNNDGVYAGAGEYKVKLIYNNKEGERITSEFGTYPIEGILFKDGIAYAKMANKEIAFADIVEITDYKG